MSAENFQPSLRRVLGTEGGYSNDPKDRGGPTMWGITHRDYDAYRKLKGEPTLGVVAMTEAERDEIYRKKYWLGGRCDEMPSGIDYCLFDGAVNSGVAQSVKWLQRALGVELVDGHVGDHTLLAARDSDAEAVISHMCDQRRAFMKMLKNYDHFKGGWNARVDHVESVAHSIVRPDEEGARELGPASMRGAKAHPDDIKPPVVSQSTATATTAGAASAGAAVNQIQDQLAPFSDTLTYVKYALLACALVGVALTIYSIWKANKIKEAM